MVAYVYVHAGINTYHMGTLMVKRSSQRYTDLKRVNSKGSAKITSTIIQIVFLKVSVDHADGVDKRPSITSDYVEEGTLNKKSSDLI